MCEFRFLKSFSCCSVLVALILLTFAGCQQRTDETDLEGLSEVEARPPNIVLIVADDLGWGDLGCYGQEDILTPSLDLLAREGIRFTDFYAGSTVCAPSRSVLMTGLHTGHTYIRGNSKNGLRPEDLTVAEVLQKKGYRTGQFGKWGLGGEGTTGLPTRQGFDYFFGYLDQSHAHNYYPSFLVRNEERVPLANVVPDEGRWGQGVASEKVEYSHDLIAEEALDFVRRNQDRPFFLYVPFTTPHANNEAGEVGMEVPDYGPYFDADWPDPQKGLAAMITRMDADVGRLIDLLEELDIASKTVVFFTSDNGPHAEGGNDPDFFDSNGPLRGIKRDLYEGGIRVPLIVRWPTQTPANVTSNHVSYFGDFMATAADLVGVEPPPHLDSISILPTILGEISEQEEHEYLYWEFYERGSAQAVRAGKWKAVRKPMLEGEVELYDLSEDVGEENNIASENPEVVERLVGYMEEAHVPSELWQAP